jgi:hypothetical protein
MIYCVIPRELEGELYEKMVAYYDDNPDVTVIIDRRTGPNRRSAGNGGGKRVIRDRHGGDFSAEDEPAEGSALRVGRQGASAFGNVPGMRARLRSRMTRLPPPFPAERRLGPVRRSMMTVTSGLSS